jgi:hypothetical protein
LKRLLFEESADVALAATANAAESGRRLPIPFAFEGAEDRVHAAGIARINFCTRRWLRLTNGY